jgi:hypothetical protein
MKFLSVNCLLTSSAAAFNLSRIHFSTRLSFSDGWAAIEMMEKYTVVTLYLQRMAGDEILIKFEHGKLGGVEDFVTEFSIAFHAKDLKVNITT